MSPITQLDGHNSSFSGPSEDSFSTILDSSQSIPVIIGHRPEIDLNDHPRIPVRRTIVRNNKVLSALNLPIFTVYNMRSIWSKFLSLVDDMEERESSLSILSEVWEKKENPEHQETIEEVCEMKDIKYISTARPGSKRGGGCAIVLRGNLFTISKLNISVPKPLEVCWGLMRPTKPLGEITKIFIGSFYCPPNSRSKSRLISHMSTTYHSLKVTHPSARTIIAGDKNDLKTSDILAINPNFSQIVDLPTRKDKTIDIVITDMEDLFQRPAIVPPVPVDENKTGSPSDHNGVHVIPIDNFNEKETKKENEFKSVRPIPQSALYSFGQAMDDNTAEAAEKTTTKNLQKKRKVR